MLCIGHLCKKTGAEEHVRCKFLFLKRERGSRYTFIHEIFQEAEPINSSGALEGGVGGILNSCTAFECFVLTIPKEKYFNANQRLSPSV